MINTKRVAKLYPQNAVPQKLFPKILLLFDFSSAVNLIITGAKPACPNNINPEKDTKNNHKPAISLLKNSKSIGRIIRPANPSIPILTAAAMKPNETFLKITLFPILEFLNYKT